MTHEKLREEVLKEPLAKKILLRPKALKQLMSLYNSLCNKCKPMAAKKPKAEYTEYCIDCQQNVKERLEKVKKCL